jgi:hypothetical protein
MKSVLAGVLGAFIVALSASVAHADEAVATPSSTPPPPTAAATAAAADPATAAAPPSEPAPAPAAAEAPPATPTSTPTSTTPVDEAAAAAALEACNKLLGGEVLPAIACFRSVVVKHAGSLAAAKADASIYVLERTTTTSSTLIPPGRLGVTAASGLFGVWNGVAAGWVVAANVSNVDGLLLVGGTGLASVALGTAMGAGGYFLADHMKLDEGAARLLASSLVWGTVLGAGMTPAITSAIPTTNNGGPAVAAGVGTVVGMGYVGAGAALLATSMMSFDEAEVSVMNSGAALGMLVGLLALPNLASANVTTPLPYSATFVGSTVAGLGAGALLGRTFDLTWGETLLCDLGMVLGGVLGGATAVLASPALARLPPQGSTAVLSGLPAVGLIGGYGAMLGFVTSWRGSRGAPIWRDAPPVHAVAALLPVGRDVVPTWGFAGEL